MKKKIFIITAIGLFLYSCFRYMGLFIFWLLTPGDGELRPAERILFEQIKKESNALDIWREPKYHISNPKDTVTYRVIIRNREAKKTINKDSLKNEANKISIKLENSLNLNSKFINYIIHFESSGEYGYDVSYKFKRIEIANSKASTPVVEVP